MKTENLIHALAADMTLASPMWDRRATLLILSGITMSLVIFFVFLGIRSDMNAAIFDPHVIFKFIFSASIIITGALISFSVLRPGSDPTRLLRWMKLPIMILGVGIGYELMTSDSREWLSGMIGHYPIPCLRNIPALTSGPFIGLVVIAKRGAPVNLSLAGSLIGATSGGIGAFIYALHCPDDSALFVAIWYSLAIMVTSAIGYVLGHKLLRW